MTSNTNPENITMDEYHTTESNPNNNNPVLVVHKISKGGTIEVDGYYQLDDEPQNHHIICGECGSIFGNEQGAKRGCGCIILIYWQKTNLYINTPREKSL